MTPTWLLRRISNAKGGFGPRILEPDEARLLEEIRRRTGRENAISRKELFRLVGGADRALRRCAKSLIEEFGIPIGTTAQNGYFLIVSEGDRVAAQADLRSRIASLSRRMKCLSAPNEMQGGLFGDPLDHPEEPPEPTPEERQVLAVASREYLAGKGLAQ